MPSKCVAGMQAFELEACGGGVKEENVAPVITSCQPSLYSPLRMMPATNLFCWSSLLSSCCWPISSCPTCSRLASHCCPSWPSTLSASRQRPRLGPHGSCRCPPLFAAPVKSDHLRQSWQNSLYLHAPHRKTVNFPHWLC